MIIEAKKLPPQMACEFKLGHIYLNKSADEPRYLFIASSVAGYQVLICLINGNIWDLRKPFGNVGPAGWVDVTDMYKIVSV